MKNRIISLILCALLSVVVTACGSEKATGPQKASKQSGTENLVSYLSNYNITGDENLSNGCVFVNLVNSDYFNSDGSINYTRQLIGCIDTHGKVNYCIEYDMNNHYYCYDGCINILTKDRWVCIDKKGEIQFTYRISDSENGTESEIICGGDKFIEVRERKTGFTSKEKSVYKIIDSKGNVVLEYEDVKINPQYLGDGIFYLDSQSAFDEDLKLISLRKNIYAFNAETQEFIETPCPDEEQISLVAYQNGNYFGWGKISTADGKLISLNECIAYDSLALTYEKRLPDAAYKNGYLIYYKDDVPYIYDFINDKSYNCFSELGAHERRFYYYNEYIVAIIKGDDDNTYYMIADKNGNTVHELTLIPNSHGKFDDTGVDFINGKAEITCYMQNANKSFTYDLRNKNSGLKTVTDPDSITYHSDYYEGWTQVTYREYNDDGNPIALYHPNYMNSDGDFLFKVNDNKYPVIYVKESQIVNY